MDVLFAVAISAVVVVYNNTINRWGPFHGVAYVPVNLAFALLVTVVAASTLGLSPTELGLNGDAGRTLVPVALVSVFAAGAFGLAVSQRGHLIADKRVAGMRSGALVWYVLLRIPIGTALVEETIFRGVLFAMWREAGASDGAAALYASAAFGLWHVAPTVIGVRMNRPLATRNALWASVVAAVAFTTIAGLVLTWLRVWSEGLLGPILLHAGANSTGALAAAVACRRKPVATSVAD